jgi:uncharacterized protein (DUF952 family)
VAPRRGFSSYLHRCGTARVAIWIEGANTRKGNGGKTKMQATIYKVCTRAEWATARRAGSYDGSADDRRDGFIHFSTASQLAGTLAKHFSGQPDLVLLTVDVARLGPSLRWEAARDGSLFPHLYGTLPLEAVVAEALLPDGEAARQVMLKEHG